MPPDFQTLFESCPGMYLVLLPNPPQFTIAGATDAYLNATFTSRSSIVGQDLFAVFPDNPDDPSANGVANLRASLGRVLLTGRTDVMQVQKYDIRKPGSSTFEERFWSPVNSPIRNSKNEIIYILHQVEDVTAMALIKQKQQAQQKRAEVLQIRTEEMASEIKLRGKQISEQEESIRQSNERLRSILDTAYDAFIAMDSRGLITDWNLQSESTFGWTKQEAIGRYLHDTIIPKRFKTSHIKGLRRFLDTGIGPAIGRRMELMAVKKDGKEIPIEITINAVGQGEHIVFGAFIKDISERERTEVFQLVQLEVTRLLVESASVANTFNRSLETICKGFGWEWGAFWRVGRSDGKLFLDSRYFNRGTDLSHFEAATQEQRLAIGDGLAGRVWLTKTPVWILSIEDDPLFSVSLEALRAGMTGAAAFPILVGEEFLGVLEFLGRDIHHPDQKWLEIMTDLTTRLGLFLQRKEAEDKLRQSEEQFSALVEGVKDYAIIGLNPEGFVTSWNRGARQIIGYESDEIIGKHFSTFYPRSSVENHFPAVELSSATALGRFEDEGWRIRKDRSQFWANVSITPIFDRNEKLVGFSKVTRDMTERKNVEESLSRLNEELEARVEERTEELKRAKLAAEDANHAKSAFLANMSHEIRTPLGAVLGFSELLMNPQIPNADKLTFMDTIRRNGELLSNVINDILDLSKVEIRKIETERRDTPLSEVLTDITSLLGLKAREKSVSIDVTLDGAVPKMIKTDPLRLRQILLNIIGNAIKFTERGSVSVTVRLDTSPTGLRKLHFSVTDTGHGISPEQATKLFQPFSQADISTRRRFGGTGLGLILSRRLANLLGGDVVLTKSAIGSGSTFTISIDPGNLESSDLGLIFDAEIDGTPAKPVEKRLDGLQILFADDSPDNQVLVSRYLRLAGAHVETAENGKVAIEKALQKNYDILLMDLQMPVMDGYEATAKLRSMGYKTPIIALTAHALKEERKRCLESGFDAHVSKPINKVTLIDGILQCRENRTITNARAHLEQNP